MVEGLPVQGEEFTPDERGSVEPRKMSEQVPDDEDSTDNQESCKMGCPAEIV